MCLLDVGNLCLLGVSNLCQLDVGNLCLLGVGNLCLLGIYSLILYTFRAIISKHIVQQVGIEYYINIEGCLKHFSSELD